uniref:Amidase domain-containing protein n=1 Tax=Cannabis sativa TaxID=3483 RepID=A0A803NVN2_CANSA
MLEIVKGAEEFNIPIIRANRKLVASINGGLQYPSVLVFNPKWGTSQHQPPKSNRFKYPSSSATLRRPSNDEDIAFMTITELGQLIKTKQITSLELTKIFLRRLKRYNGVLKAVVSYTEELAYKQAKRADYLLDKGVYLGPLHGIPYGLKDIISVPKYKTTWGSTTFKNQVLNTEAWVYKRLKSAGAVLVAKLVSGMVPFAIEPTDKHIGNILNFYLAPHQYRNCLYGIHILKSSITYSKIDHINLALWDLGTLRSFPQAHLRPHVWLHCHWAEENGFNHLWSDEPPLVGESLDKVGPFCRDAADCAIVLDVIRGKDPNDMSSRDMPFKDPFSVDITKLRVGYVGDAEMEVVKVLESKGVKMVPFKLNYTVDSVQGILNFTMDVDMLAHFDEWQRSGSDRAYEAQEQWPIELRRARLIPAVDYVQAQRARGRLIREVEDNLKGIDGFIGNATDWEKVCMGNLVGMPVIVVPTGLKPISHPPPNTRRRTTITTAIYAPPQHDHIGLALAMAYQSVTHHHKQRPPIDDLGPHDVLHIPSPPPSPLP